MTEQVKKLVPKLRFPEFKDVSVWEVKKLEDICIKISQGGTPDTTIPEYWNGEIEWLTPAEMGKLETRFINGTNRKITKVGLKNCSSDLLPIDSVILSTRAPIGHLLINKVEMAINQGCKGLVPLASTDTNFLYYSLVNNRRALSDLGAGNTFKELSSSALKSFAINIPQLPEQQKIADCLSSLDNLISAQNQKVEALKQHKNGLMQQLFPAEGETVPKLRFPEFENEGEWVLVELNKLGELISGLTYSPEDVRESGLLVLRSSNVQNGQISLEDNVYVTPTIKGANFAKPNDILICVRNGSKTLIGKNALIPVDMPLCTHGAFMTVFRATTPSFVFQLFQTDAYQKQVDGDLGATINSINGSKFLKYEFWVPKKPDEQKKIANCLSSLDDLITNQTQKVEALKLQKNGLMQRLFPVKTDLEAI